MAIRAAFSAGVNIALPGANRLICRMQQGCQICGVDARLKVTRKRIERIKGVKHVAFKPSGSAAFLSKPDNFSRRWW